MKQYVAPIDMTSGKFMCIAEVEYANKSIKVIQMIWVNMSLDYIKRGWDILGERGLVVDMENDLYSQGDLYSPQGLIYDVFESNKL